MEDVLVFLRSHPHYEEFERTVLEYRPVVPSHNPKDDNTELWKAESARQEGFDLCLKLFKIGV